MTTQHSRIAEAFSKLSGFAKHFHQIFDLKYTHIYIYILFQIKTSKTTLTYFFGILCCRIKFKLINY